MNLQETKKLLAEIALIDGRALSEELAITWQAILARIPFDIAQESHRLCRQDENIRWLEPKHIYARAMAAAKKLAEAEDREKQLAEAHERRKTTPAPICNHGFRLIDCIPCCRWFAKNHLDNHPDANECVECIRIMRNKEIPI